jgi:hypothetical protein
MAFDESFDALPKLVGAPAYSRPPAAVESAPRPFDPDELPLEIDQTEEERAFAAKLPARAFAPGGADVRPGAFRAQGSGAADDAATSTHAEGRSLSLRRITRFRGGRTSV